MRSNDVTITRGFIGQIASFATGAGLLAIVLAFLWRNGIDSFVIVSVVVTIISLIVWIGATPAEFRDFVTGRQVRYGTSAVFSLFLLVGIVVLIYVIVERSAIVVDMTQSESFTLDRTTIEVLENVREPMQIIGFYSPQSVVQRETDDQFFRLYEVATDGMVSRRYVDPDEEPALAATFNAQDGDVFLAYLNDDGGINFSTLSFVPDTGTQERDMTQAISRLLISGTITVYFDLSLGELDPLDNTANGLSLVNSLMQENGLVTQPIGVEALAAAGQSMPQDASALILARPRQQPSEGAIAVINNYLQNGGSLLILADTQSPFMIDGSPFNAYLWENYGLRMLDAVVVDPASSGETELDIISAAIFDSQISAGINPQNDPDSATQFRIARPIDINNDPPVPNGRIIMSSEASYAETNLDALFQNNDYAPDPGEDLPGPFTTVAFADDRADSGSRVLLIGDSDFITNGQISSPLGNAFLFMDGIGWLTDFSTQVEFTPQARVTNIPALFITGQQLDRVAFITSVIMPAIALFLGVFVWFRRSRR